MTTNQASMYELKTDRTQTPMPDTGLPWTLIQVMANGGGDPRSSSLVGLAEGLRVLVVVLTVVMVVDLEVLCPTGLSLCSDSCEKHHKGKQTDVRKLRALGGKNVLLKR